MGQRRDRLDKRLERAAVTRKSNSMTKLHERQRRDQLNLALIKKGKFPYTPGLMSWLSSRLGKKAVRITPADVTKLLQDS